MVNVYDVIETGTLNALTYNSSVVFGESVIKIAIGKNEIGQDYTKTRGPLTASPVQIKYEEKLQNFTTKFTTFLLTMKFSKSTTNAISFCSENPYLSIYVNDTFSTWGRNK